MPDRLAHGERVVGTRSLLRAIREGSVRIAYLAQDADLFITRQVEEACRAANIPLVQVNSKAELGRACQAPVPTAAAGLKK